MTLDVTAILAPVFWVMVALVLAGPAVILVARALGAATHPVAARPATRLRRVRRRAGARP